MVRTNYDYRCAICGHYPSVAEIPTGMLARKRQKLWKDACAEWPDGLFYKAKTKFKRKYICFKHFTSDCFDATGVFIAGSVPTIAKVVVTPPVAGPPSPVEKEYPPAEKNLSNADVKTAADYVCQKGNVGDTSQKGNMGDTSQKGNVGDTSQKGNVGDTSQKGNVGDTSQKGNVGDTSQKGNVGDTSQKGNVGDTSQKGNVGDTSQKGNVGDTSQKGNVGDTSQKGNVGDTSVNSVLSKASSGMASSSSGAGPDKPRSDESDWLEDTEEGRQEREPTKRPAINPETWERKNTLYYMDKYECALCNDGSLGTWKFPGPNDIQDATVKRNMFYFLNRISKRQKKSLMRKCGAYLCMGHFHEEDGFVNELGIYTLKNPKSAVPWYAGKENQLFKSVQEISPEEHSPTPTKRRAKSPGEEKCFLCPMLVHPFDLLDHVHKVHKVPTDGKIARCASASPLDCMCDLCESGGMSKRMMLTHLSQAHSSSLRQEVLKICHICDKSVESWAFTAHMDEHMASIIRVSKDKYVYKCLVCNILFPFRQRLKKHLYEEHGYEFGSIFHCDICGYVCRIGKNIFLRHLESIHLKATTECTICGKTVPKNNISGHTKNHHSDYDYKSERRLCNICGKMLCSQSTLDIHTYIHHQVMPPGHKDCACDICGSRFFVPNLLWTHIAAKHLGHTYYKWRRSQLHA